MLSIENNAIKIIRGDTGEFSIDITDASGQTYELKETDKCVFTVKKNVKSTDVLIQKEGTHIILLPEDTKNLAFGKYVYDVQVTIDGDFPKVDTIIPPSVFTIMSEVNYE